MNGAYDIEFDDIQGFVVRGFGHLPQARYAFFRITDRVHFRAWLRSEMGNGQIVRASMRKQVRGPCCALGFTAAGLRMLTSSHLVEDFLPLEFAEGIVEEQRSRLLGDVDDNAPENWDWGNSSDDVLHGVLLAFAEDAETVGKLIDSSVSEANGMHKVACLAGRVPADGKEPFGFLDGISQPIIDGTDRADELRNGYLAEARLHVVPPGEIILGYRDGSDCLPRTLAVSAAADPKGLLKPHPERAEQRDFGRNGSFVVVRQLAQDVKAFQDFVAQNAATEDADHFAAKLVGRKKDGTPLALGAASGVANDFDYLADPEGLGCPLGAHVRRSNPRSTVHADSPEAALKVTNRHRMLRRGRVYEAEAGEQGLVFVCLNASISRQFEFVQSTWCNNPLFQGVQGEVDPIIGTPGRAGPVAHYTIPRRPYRQRVRGVPAFVTVKGGGYFFLPSLLALQVLAELADS